MGAVGVYLFERESVRGLVLAFRFPVFNLAVLTNTCLYMVLLLPFKEIRVYMYNNYTGTLYYATNVHDYVCAVQVHKGMM